MPPEHKNCRQGCVLTEGSAIALNLIETDSLDKYCVIISHDCDIYNLSESRVECIVATRPSNINNAFNHTMNPRRLNITYNLDDPKPVTLELAHADRKDIPKGQFLEKGQIDDCFQLSMQQKRILKIWLAARYGRPAFPDEFENRLRIHKDFEKKMRRILEPAQTDLIGIYFQLGADRFYELPTGSPYCLAIIVVYDGIKGTKARKSAETCAIQLKELFHENYGTPDIAEDIALEECVAISDLNFSLADIRKADQWRVDFISLREEPHGELLSSSQAPA